MNEKPTTGAYDVISVLWVHKYLKRNKKPQLQDLSFWCEQKSTQKLLHLFSNNLDLYKAMICISNTSYFSARFLKIFLYDNTTKRLLNVYMYSFSYFITDFLLSRKRDLHSFFTVYQIIEYQQFDISSW